MQLTTGERVAPLNNPVQKKKRTLGRLERQEERAFYLFITPWLIGFVFFGGGPIIALGIMSLTNWQLLASPQWVGLGNYVQIFQDPLFYLTVKNTLLYGIGAVGLGVITSFLQALLLNQKAFGQAFFRTVFYLPSVIAGIATAFLWFNIFHPDFGLLNYLIGLFGGHGPDWLFSETWVIPSLIMMSIWNGGNTMIIYLAGLQNIPAHLYEAAAMDGAGWWSKFWNVTVPMMSPVIFFNIITGFITSLQAFTLILVMTNGGPANASLVYGLYIYRQAFQYFNMGYASALSWVLILIIMIITLVQLYLAKHWVYYEGAARGGK